MGKILHDVVRTLGWTQFFELPAPNGLSVGAPHPTNFDFDSSPFKQLYDALTVTSPHMLPRFWQGLDPDHHLEPEIRLLINQITEGGVTGLKAAPQLMDKILSENPSVHLMEATIDLIVKHADRINGKALNAAGFLLILVIEKMPQLIQDKKWGIPETKKLLLKIPPLLQRTSIETKLLDLFEALLQTETWDDDCSRYLIWLYLEQGNKHTSNLLNTIYQMHRNGLLKPQHIKQMAESPFAWVILKSLSEEQMKAVYWDTETSTILLKALDQSSIPFALMYVFVELITKFLGLWQEKNLWTSDHTQLLALQIKKALAHRQTRSHQAMGRYLQSIENTFKGRPEKLVITLYLKAALIFSNDITKAYKHIFDFLAHFEKPSLFEPGAYRSTWAFLAGGKWAGLEKARQLGLPVIDGFSLPVLAKPEITNITEALHNLEKRSGKTFGDSQNPLLLAVRSGAPISFPGRLATITNVGINEAIFETLKRQHGEAFASDTYARFIRSYVCAVERINKNIFDKMTDLTNPIQTLKNYKNYLALEGIQIPEDPEAQLYLSMKAVQASWEIFAENEGKELMLPQMPESMMGTAITINEMKFGNLNAHSGSGVATSRNAINAKKESVIDYKRLSQGEDLMTGGHHVSEQRDDMDLNIREALETALALLEKEWGYAVQVEFCVENGKLFLTQVKDLSAAPQVQYKIITDLKHEGVISETHAQHLKALLPSTLSTIKVAQNQAPLTHATLTNRLAISGHLAFSQAEITALHERGQRAVFVSAHNRQDDSLILKAGDGIIDIWGFAKHAFDTFTQNGIGLAVFPQGQWASKDESAFTLTETTFSSGDEITITADGQIYEGLHEVVEVPIESVVLGGALMAGQMMPPLIPMPTVGL